MSIVYIGMDVHKDSYTLSGLYRNGEMKKELNTKTTQASPEAVIRYIRDVRKNTSRMYLSSAAMKPDASATTCSVN